MFLLVTYVCFLLLPFASRNLVYRTATLFGGLTMVINTTSICARLFLSSPDFLDTEALAYYFRLFLPIFVGCSLVIGVAILPRAISRDTVLAKKIAIVIISTAAFLYLSDITIPLAGDLFSGGPLHPLEYYFIPDFQRITSARWDYIFLTANTALAASATMAIVPRWSRPL